MTAHCGEGEEAHVGIEDTNRGNRCGCAATPGREADGVRSRAYEGASGSLCQMLAEQSPLQPAHATAPVPVSHTLSSPDRC